MRPPALLSLLLAFATVTTQTNASPLAGADPAAPARVAAELDRRDISNLDLALFTEDERNNPCSRIGFPHYSACPVYNAKWGGRVNAADGGGSAKPQNKFECVDTMSGIETCGGCSLESGAVDCSSLPGVDSVMCKRGRCVILACEEGLVRLADGTGCRARRRKPSRQDA
ncbi:hypothetical protein T439DRAFT_324220 [Meredithblackwellia eburnea MCA 4105]